MKAQTGERGIAVHFL